MARITVEDCLKKIDSQYDLVLLAKERTSQLNAGSKALVTEDDDKNTVLALREIGEGKVSLKTIEDSAINKLRKVQSEPTEVEDLEVDQEDDFDKIYKGEISKSGVPILPSKRARKIPEKIQVSKEDLAELKNEAEVTDSGQKIEPIISDEETAADDIVDDVQVEDDKIEDKAVEETDTSNKE